MCKMKNKALTKKKELNALHFQVDVEIEEDEEEPTLRAAGAEVSSPNKNGSNLFENSDVDDEDEDALGQSARVVKAIGIDLQ